MFKGCRSLYLLEGTRLTLKTGVKTLGGRISFLPPKSPSENNYYLFNSRFWHHLGVQILGTKILISWPILYVDLKAIKAFDQVKKVLVLYLLRFLRNVVLKLMPWQGQKDFAIILAKIRDTAIFNRLPYETYLYGS